MGKSKSFADKVSKGIHDNATHCPKCGESLVRIKLITTEKSEKTGAYKFNQKNVGMCKCNESEITG